MRGMIRRGWYGASLVACVLLLASPPAQGAYLGEEYVDGMRTGGVGLEIGGGLYGFTGDLSLQTGTGGSWTGSLIFGLRAPVSLELSYTGAANAIEDQFTPDGEILLSTILEGVLRINLLTDTWAIPYLFGGAGWYHFSFDEASAPLLNPDDTNGVSIPLGIGTQLFLSDRWTAGFRFAYRIISGAPIGDSNDPDYRVLDDDGDSWEGSARIGIVF